MAMTNAKKILSNKVRYAKSIVDLVKQTDVVVITTAWNEFGKFDLSLLKNKKKKIVIDCWRIFSYKSEKNIKYIPLGKFLS